MIDGWMVECHVRLRSKCIDHDYSTHSAREPDEGDEQLATLSLQHLSLVGRYYFKRLLKEGRVSGSSARHEHCAT